MKIEELFGKDLIKKLNKTHKSHSSFTQDNMEMKQLFKTIFNKRVISCIAEVVDEIGYKEEKETYEEFYQKLDSGNYDDNDVEIFKNLVIPHIDQIMERLKEGGDFTDE